MLNSVQVLRAYAAIIVMVGHALLEADAAFGIERTYYFPWVSGVHVFFVISGFIMAYTNAGAFGSAAGAKAFVRRRLKRIVPLYWIFTTLILVVLLAGGPLHSVTLDWGDVLASYLFWPDVNANGQVVPLLALGWTLNYEMFFYALFALALLLPRRVGLVSLSAFMVALVLVGPFLTPVPLSFWSDPIILEFVAGAWLGYTFTKVGKRFASLPLALAGFAISLLWFAGADMLDLNRAIECGPPSVLLVASAVFLVPAEAEWRIPAWAVLLGNSSYALYLSHRFPLRLVTIAGQRAGIDSPALYVLASVTVCIAVGVAVYLFIEKPILSRRLRNAYA